MKRWHGVGLLGIVFLPLAALAQGSAHEHGAARLTLVQEAGSVTVMLDSPLDAMVGFEHAPKSAAQHAALATAAELLREPDNVVVLAADADCRSLDADIDLPYAEHGDDHAAHEAHEAHHGHDEDEVHADVAASYTFACARPEKLDRVTVKAFASFPRLHRINAEAATASGQGLSVLDAESTVWSLPDRP